MRSLKNSFASFGLVLLFCAHAMGAVTATTVWKFDSAGTANMANGCGFDPGPGTGTDWTTTQTGPKYSLTGLTSAGAGSIILTSSASSDMVNNVIHVDGGTNFTQSWFLITSVSAGVSLTVTTNAAGTGVTTGVGATGTGKIGGPCNFGSATLDTAWFGQPQPGNMIWIKNGSYTIGSAITNGTNGSATAPIVVKGYNSSIGDITITNPVGRPTLILGANNFPLNTSTTWEWWNLIFTTTAANGVNITGGNMKFINNKVTNTSRTAGRNALVSGASNFIVNNELISYVGNALSIAAATTGQVLGNYIHDSDTCITDAATTTTLEVTNNILEGCVTKAYNISAAHTGAWNFLGNTIYGSQNKIGIGISITTGSTNLRAMNNIFYGLATGISHADSQTQSFDNWNDFNNNSTDVTNWTKGAQDTTCDPGFSINNVQYTGATATTSGSVLTQAGATLPTFTVGKDFLYLKSGTGITAGVYGITSNTSTTVTLDSAPGTNATADKVWQVTTGHNFAPNVCVKRLGFPGLFPGTWTQGYLDLGAAQRREYGRPVQLK